MLEHLDAKKIWPRDFENREVFRREQQRLLWESLYFILGPRTSYPLDRQLAEIVNWLGSLFIHILRGHTSSQIGWDIEEPGEQCTVVFALIVTEPLLWVCLCVCGGGYFHHIIWITNAAKVDSSVHLSISAHAVGMANLCKLPSQCKTCYPAPSSS